MSISIKTRIAPTPSGYMHLGNALNFVHCYIAARRESQSSILLRIDDLDVDRKRPEYVADVFDTLHWLGIEWDEGPHDVADFEQHWSQHIRLETYENALAQLRQQNLVYPCVLSRKTIQYSGYQRSQNIDLDSPDVTWRALTPDGFLMPDFVLRKRDAVPAYQIASLCDDIHFGINMVVRGEDLKTSSAAQQWLAKHLGYTAFERIKIVHHPLVIDESGEKLSKSAGSLAVKTLRRQGASPRIVYELVAQQLGCLGANTLSDLL